MINEYFWPGERLAGMFREAVLSAVDDIVLQELKKAVQIDFLEDRDFRPIHEIAAVFDDLCGG